MEKLKIKELHLTKKDFKVDWFSGKGGGGQHRNKHMNCCRITHVESGITTTGQSHKDRPSNQKEAFNKLANILISKYCIENQDREVSNERVRTYHQTRNEVKDHRTDKTDTYTNTVEKGNMSKFLDP